MIGETISHYRILERLGTGGMGEVYKAEDLRLHRQAALKILRVPTKHQSASHSEESKKRFLREAQAAAALNHPNIATIYGIDQFTRDGVEHSFIVMEYVPGHTLGEYARTHRLSADKVIEFVLQIADALEAAHTRGIVHRDVKPSNVIVAGENRIKVLDFGLAKFMHAERMADDDTKSDAHSDFMQTTPGLVMGTLAYMSPEQAMGEEVDHRSDIFSLGVLLYELLTGRLPFSGESTVALLNNLLHSDPPAPSLQHPHITQALSQIVRKMLEKDREQRYQHLGEVRRDLLASKQHRRVYEFGQFRLDTAERLLLRDGEVIDLKPKVFELLVLLVQSAGRLMEKEQLLQALWPDTVVEEVNLNVNISTLRKALGETPAAPQYIETVPKRGYRFISTVTEHAITPQPIAATQAASTAVADDREAVLFTANTVHTDLDTKSDTFHAAKKTARSYSLRPAPWLLAATLLITAASGSFWWWWFKRQAQPITSGMRTIAVLPFKSLKTDKADDAELALGLGMADALITRLGSLQHLTVRSTSTVQKYANAPVDPIAAGRELGVDAVLEGRLQRDDKMIRVTAQLLKVSDGSSLWAGKFDDYFTNVFALQDSLSEKMVEALSMQLTSDERERLAKHYTENTEAYQLYSQGRYFLFKYQYAKALGFHQAAAAKDPDYPLAYTGLAVNYIALAVTTQNRQEMLDKAVEAANKALKLDPNLDEAHNALGFVKFLGDWDWAGAEQEFRRAIALNPNNADVRQNYADLLSALSRHDEALSEIERAREIEPVSSTISQSYASALFFARRYDQAQQQCQKTLELDPQHPGVSGLLLRIYVAKSMFEQAIAESAKRKSQETAFVRLATAYANARLGRRAESEKAIQSLQKENPSGTRYTIAMIHAGLDEKDRAFEWLEKAFADRDNQMIHIKVDPEWDKLRSDPRFDDLLRRMKLN